MIPLKATSVGAGVYKKDSTLSLDYISANYISIVRFIFFNSKNVSLEVNTVSLLRNPHKADKHEITLFAGFFPESFCQSKTIALASSRIRYQDKHPYIRYWSQSEKF